MKLVILAVLCTMLLVFGCTGTSQPGANQSAQVSGQNGAGNIQTATPAEPSAQSAPETAPAPNASQANASAEPAPAAVQAQSGIQMGEAIQAGSPYACSGNVVGMNITIEVLGNHTRSAIRVMGKEYVTIVLPTETYTNNYPAALAQPEKYGNCTWFKTDLGRLEEGLGLGAGADSANVTAALTQARQDAGITCSPGQFGPEAFAVNGSVCDVTDEAIANFKAMSAYGK